MPKREAVKYKDWRDTRGLALDVSGHARIQVLVRSISCCLIRDPGHALCDAPHVRVHGELIASQAEHEDAGHGFLPHALEPVNDNH